MNVVKKAYSHGAFFMCIYTGIIILIIRNTFNLSVPDGCLCISSIGRYTCPGEKVFRSSKLQNKD